MTETLLIGRPPAAKDEDQEPYRPAKAEYGIGRMLRRVAGVNDVILDWVPEERPRYTRLGAIVVNTGLMAALSMLVLLSKVNVSLPLMIPVALMWGYLILSFDGWLVASTHGVLGMAKLQVFLPRLLISLLMGAVIAEPLLLWVFGPAIHTEVRDQRKAVVDQYESKLKDCNPISGEAATVIGCTDLLLNVQNPLVSIRQELANKVTERTKLQALISGINTELARREELARTECNGTTGPGLTGRVGEGPNCKRNRAEADRYRASANLDTHQAALTKLNNEIVALTTREAGAGRIYAEQISAEIVKKVAEKRDNQEQIGILDEDRALGALSSRSAFVMIGSWLLRLLLVTIDSLPVLTKLMSRTTTYDVLVSRQLDISSRLHDKYTMEREQRDAGRVDVAIQRNTYSVRSRMDEIDEATSAARADREAMLDEQIEDLAARLRNDGGST